MVEKNNTKSSWRKVVLLLIVLVIGIAVSGKYLWQRFGKETVSFFLKEHTAAIYTATITDLQNKIAQHQTDIQKLQEDVQKQGADKAISWRPIAIGHLIRMADLTLNTTGDVKTALAFLVTAKKYTDDLGNSTITRILNKDIVKLQAIPIVATEELILKINMVSQQITTLPIAPPPTTVATPLTIVETQQYSGLLNNFLKNTIKALKDIVIIHRQTIEPIPPPEQMAILRFNIQNKLSQAELAVMQKQNKLYQMCLTQIVDLITKYFSSSNAAVTNILQTLQELRQINLQPDLPSLTELLMAIQKLTKVPSQPTT